MHSHQQVQQGRHREKEHDDDGQDAEGGHSAIHPARHSRSRSAPLLLPLLLVAIALLAASCSCGLDLTLPVDASRPLLTAPPHADLMVLTTETTESFATRAASLYKIFRPLDSDPHVTTHRVAGLAVHGGQVADAVGHFESDAGRMALRALSDGEADMALLPITPTSGDARTYPDIISFPFWAEGFAPVLNVPEAEGATLTISMPALVGIFNGSVTTWSHPLIQSVNRLYKMPNKPIQLVLPVRASSYVRDLIIALRAADATLDIAVSSLPQWPLDRYASYKFVEAIEGSASHVLSNPYSFGVSIVRHADKLGIQPCRMINAAGLVVRPSHGSISAALNELGVSSTELDRVTGKPIIRWTASLSYALGPNAWPLISTTSVLFHKRYSRTTCRARSELAKFVRWMLHSESVYYTLAVSESAAMLPHEMSEQLGLESALINVMRCGDSASPINADMPFPITVGGGAAASLHNSLRETLLQAYFSKVSDATFVSEKMNEKDALHGLLNPVAKPDFAWFFSQTYRSLYPGDLESLVETGKITVVHMALYGVVPCYHLATEVLERGRAMGLFPLRIGMEALAQVFLGEVRSWTDSRLTYHNPLLSQAFGSDDTTITLVLCGRGSADQAHLTTISNHMVMFLNTTAAFQSSGLSWSLPADWSGVVARLEQRQVPFVWVESEAEMEAAVRRIPGSIGYVLGYQNHTDVESEFQLVMPIQMDPLDSAMVNVTIPPTPANYLACANAAPASASADFIGPATTSVDPLYIDCWPFPILMSLALPTNVQLVQASISDGHDGGSTLTTGSLEALCKRQLRITEIAKWLTSDPATLAPAMVAGRVSMAQLPAWNATIQAALNQVMCGDEPLLWVRPVIWSLSSSVHDFAVAGAVVVLALCAAVMGLVIFFKHRTIIHAAVVPLQICVIVGVALLAIAPVLFVRPPSANVCTALEWVFVFGIGLAFAPMCLKLFRVYRSYRQARQAKWRRTAPISVATMLAAMGALVVWNAVILGVAQSRSSGGGGSGILRPLTLSRHEDDGREHFYTQCSMPDEMLTEALLVLLPPVVMTLLAACAGFVVRGVSSVFNESSHLSWAVWNVTLTTAIIIPLMLLTGGMQSDTGVFLLVFLLLWVSVSVMCFSFLQRLYTLLGEEWAVAAANKAASSRSGWSSHRSHGSLRTGTASGGSRGGGSGLNTSLLSITMPSLEGVDSIAVLERYITALESQLRLARARRLAQFGAAAPEEASICAEDDEAQGDRDGDGGSKLSSHDQTRGSFRRGAPSSFAKAAPAPGGSRNQQRGSSTAVPASSARQVSPAPNQRFSGGATAANDWPGSSPLKSSASNGATAPTANRRTSLRIVSLSTSPAVAPAASPGPSPSPNSRQQFALPGPAIHEGGVVRVTMSTVSDSNTGAPSASSAATAAGAPLPPRRIPSGARRPLAISTGGHARGGSADAASGEVLSPSSGAVSPPGTSGGMSAAAPASVHPRRPSNSEANIAWAADIPK